MLAGLPGTPAELLRWSWQDIEPCYQELLKRPLDAGVIDDWLNDWSDLTSNVSELHARLFIEFSRNTADPETEARFTRFIETVRPKVEAAEHRLKLRLVSSGVEPAGFELVLRKIRSEVSIYSESNLALLAEEQKLCTEYDRVNGAQVVQWRGEEKTMGEMYALLLDPDRGVREASWRLAHDARAADRPTLNRLWEKLVQVRTAISANAGCDDYRSYVWRQRFRFDYGPEDCRSFHRAIEEMAVPAAVRAYERRRRALGIESVRPWDTEVDPFGTEQVRPYETTGELIRRAKSVFEQIDSQFAGNFQTMLDEELIDLERRKNKGPGAFEFGYTARRRPFVFVNPTGTHFDMTTLMHECGHAFHEFARAGLPSFFHRSESYLPLEFAEVASMAMELLATPYLSTSRGGFYDESEAARVRVSHLEQILVMMPYVALVDAFQHWVYENPRKSIDAGRCDEEWCRLWDRFMPFIDYGSIEQAKELYWHRQLHIFKLPFYFIEYGFAQLGAVQIWARSLEDYGASIASYKEALALGATAAIPDLFSAAGAHFAFDRATLEGFVGVVERTIEDLRRKI